MQIIWSVSEDGITLVLTLDFLSYAKVVLYALFSLVGFVILLYALTILGPNFKGMDNENTATPSNNTASTMQQLEESEQQFESLQQKGRIKTNSQ